MIGVYVTVLILLVAVSAVGQALVSISLGVRRGEPIAFSWLAPAVGVAALLILEGIAARLPGHAITAAAALAIATLLALWWLQERLTHLRETLLVGVPVVAIALLGASIPFAIAGHVGILGAGLINDDMASHLLIAEYVRGDSGFVPSFVKGGYPTGPHAIVVAIAQIGGWDLVDVFSGFTLALAPLTGMIALGLLGEEMSRPRRVIGAALVSLTYLGASYLSSGAFKEPLQALILIAFGVLLAQLLGMRTVADPERPPAPGVRPILRVVPVAALAAASVFNYSLPGLLWIGAVGAVVLAARLWVVRPQPKLPPDWKRRLAPYLVGAVVLVLLATVQEWSRIADFARLQALNPERFGSDLGNLKEAISPLEALGIWPTGDYRTAAADAGGPTVAFYALAVLALLALGAGLVDSRRRGLWALPAALAAIAGVWLLTAVFSTPYIAAKALAIAAPLVMLIAVRGVLSLKGRAVTALAVAFVLLASASSLLALRQAAVGPSTHASELAKVRDVVQGEPVLFLGRDDFIAFELAGSDEITGIVANYYSVSDARSRFQKSKRGGEKFDVDALFPKTLDEFKWVLSPSGQPRSGAPPRFVPVVETRDYILWKNTGKTGRRKTLDEGIYPGAYLHCDTPALRREFTGKGTTTVWKKPPVIGDESKWQPSATATDSRPASQALTLSPGTWDISLQYDSRRPVHVTSDTLGLDETIPANLDFRGPSPFFPVGEVDVSERTKLTITAAPVQPNLFARLVKAPNDAHLRAVSATPEDVIRRVHRRRSCGRYVDWYRARG